jgi:hypothetical protein
VGGGYLVCEEFAPREVKCLDERPVDHRDDLYRIGCEAQEVRVDVPARQCVGVGA